MAEEPPLSGPGLLQAISSAIDGLDLAKSAGIEGLLNGTPTKGDYVRKDRSALIVRAMNRIRRLVLLGPTVGYMTAKDKYRAGLRSLVNPQVKDEGHALDKVYRFTLKDGEKVFEKDAEGRYVRQEHPRWRLILIQGIVDHVVGVVLHKQCTEASVGLFQSMPDQECTLSRGFGVGFSTRHEASGG